MFEVLSIPVLCFEQIRNRKNEKIENYIKRLDKFWTLLISLSEKEFCKEEGVVRFKSTYIDKTKLNDAGFKDTTIKRYFLILEENGYLTRDYDTYNDGISKKTGKSRKIGNALFVTLYPTPITPLISQRKREKLFLQELTNSKIGAILKNE